jgi:hypothetical protein
MKKENELKPERIYGGGEIVPNYDYVVNSDNPILVKIQNPDNALELKNGENDIQFVLNGRSLIEVIFNHNK